MVIKNKNKAGMNDDSVNVIDLGGPQKPRISRSPYTPNARLYPGPRILSKKNQQESNTKKKIRQQKQLVPNPRLYQPCPRRLQPSAPPLNPSVSWSPRAPTALLDTASGAALRLAECRTVQNSLSYPNGTVQRTEQEHVKRKAFRQKRPVWQDGNTFSKSFSTPRKMLIKQQSKRWFTTQCSLLGDPYANFV